MVTKLGTSIEEAAKWLMNNDVVAIPTETVYGLAGNALNEEAVLKIFKAKNRPYFNPLIVHTYHWKAISGYVSFVPKEAEIIASHFSPGPVTFLLEKHNTIPDLVTAGFNKVAIRIPNHLLTLSLLKELPFPLAAPSANRFGYVSPTTAAHVQEGLNGFIPYILDGGPCSIGLESTIIDFEEGEVIIRRSGGISAEAIAEVIGKQVHIRTHANEHPVAPGQLKSHYATNTPLYIGNTDRLIPAFKGQKVAVIDFGKTTVSHADFRFNLSEEGNMDEAARNLFMVMRQADSCGAAVILATTLPENGIGAAINDRLKRAEHTSKI